MSHDEATMTDAPRGRAPTTRPETRQTDATSDAAVSDADDDRHEDAHSNIRPGARLTRNVDMLITEARMVAEDGWRPTNPAQPIGERTAEAFHKRADELDLEPAWMRPWEDDDE